jgi:hypothetical protein
MCSWVDITPRKEKKRKEADFACLIKERKIVNKVTHMDGLDDMHCVFRHKCQLKVQNF